MGWIVSPLKNMLSPKPQFHKMCLIWRADVYRNNQIFKRRSLKWAQIPCDWVLIKREVWTHRKKVKEKVVCVRKQCIYKPRMPQLPSEHRKLEEARKESPQEPSEGAWPWQHLEWDFLASRIVRPKINTVVLGHPVFLVGN